MDRQSLRRVGMGLSLALLWGGLARGAATSSGTAVWPTFATGNVETDMPSTNTTAVTTIAGHPFNYTYQPQFMTDQGLVNGYAMKDIRLSYDKASDTLAVGVNFFGVAGNTDGSPDGQTNPQTVALHGSNPANFGADKSVAIALTPATATGQEASSTPLIIAGIPAVKAAGATPQSAFTVAAFQASTGGLAHSFGQTLSSNVGALAYNPSSAHPDVEFTIKNFSKIPGLNGLTNGFYLSAFSGSQQTVIVGKSSIADTFVSPPTLSPQNLNPNPGTPNLTPMNPPTVPEPTTVLAWGLIAAGAAWRFRRRQPQS